MKMRSIRDMMLIERIEIMDGVIRVRLTTDTESTHNHAGFTRKGSVIGGNIVFTYMMKMIDTEWIPIETEMQTEIPTVVERKTGKEKEIEKGKEVGNIKIVDVIEIAVVNVIGVETVTAHVIEIVAEVGVLDGVVNVIGGRKMKDMIS